MSNVADYVDGKLKEIDVFKRKIDDMCFKNLQDVFNDRCFEKIDEDGKLVWARKKQEYCGEYFLKKPKTSILSNVPLRGRRTF